MVKFFSLIGFLLIYLPVYSQKASYYKDAATDFHTFSYFYLLNCPLDAHELTDPFLDKKSLNNNEINYFIIYNEMSLKNLTLIDGEGSTGTLLINLYEGSSFNDQVTTPSGYKKKKLKGKNLVIDIQNGANKTLVWRGWIDLAKIKATDAYALYQKAIYNILQNFTIEPTIIE